MGKRILIYDDEEEILLLIKLILMQNGYNIATQTSCNNIIEDIHLEKPHLILMDLWIPDMGGENALHVIKNNESISHIPVILFSANNEIVKIYERSGATGYLKKPFDIIELINVVESNILKIPPAL